MAGRCPVILLMPQKIQKQRLKDMKASAKKKNIVLAEYCSSAISHIVTEYINREQVLKALPPDLNTENIEIVGISWFTSCLKSGSVVPVEDHHRLQSSSDSLNNKGETPKSKLPEYACQRCTPLKHHNEKLSKALEVLQMNAEMRNVDEDYSRALAFRRASCVLKSLPFKVTNIAQVNGLKDMGRHCKQVIKDILEEGSSKEVDDIINSDWIQKMKMFSSVFGVGPATAKKWIEEYGWNSIEDARSSDSISKDWRVQWGLAFHNDLMTPVTKSEAGNVVEIIKSEAEQILPGVIVKLTGGFSRGKDTGHDIDILFTHPEEGKEVGFLQNLLYRLEDLGLILCGRSEKNSYTPEVLVKDFKLSMKGQLDHFEKWLGIMKIPDMLKQKDVDITKEKMKFKQNTDDDCVNKTSRLGSLDDYEPRNKRQKLGSELSPLELASSHRDWNARRIDLIVSPYSQYYYALVGWIGSKQFNRDIRTYSQRVLNMKLTSHGLYDHTKNMHIPAKSEKEVFDNLKLEYREPWERNC